jgi:hypothetical protein
MWDTTHLAGELLGDRTVVVHLIDPFPPGPGRVWRHELACYPAGILR